MQRGVIMEELEILLEQETTNEVEIVLEEEGANGTISDYEKAINKPKINNVELIKNKSFEDLGIQEITNTELDAMFRDL